jgi:transcriptional regulator with XRE-family HTH domain
MEKAKELIEELKTTEKQVAEGTGVSTQFVWMVKKGERQGIEWRKKLAVWAREKADKLNSLADEVELEAA